MLSMSSARRGIMLVAVLASFGFAQTGMTANAATASASTGSASADTASAPVEALDNALIETMKAGRRAPFQQRYDALAPVIEQALDLPFILRISFGSGWASLSPEQQQQLVDAFRRYTIATYLDNFDSYEGQHFTIEPNPRQLQTGQKVVDTQIVSASGGSHQLAYVMHQMPDGTWKAIDVLADGAISRVAVQRSDWSSLLNRGGAPALLATLQKKTEALSQG